MSKTSVNSTIDANVQQSSQRIAKSVTSSKNKKVGSERTNDPSGTFPTGKNYPIPSFFEYRIKPKDYDSL